MALVLEYFDIIKPCHFKLALHTLCYFIGFFLGDGSPAAKVTVEGFLDLNCPDSVAAWPVLQKLAKFYQPEEVAVKVLWSPLPYHRNSMICTQVGNIYRRVDNSIRGGVLCGGVVRVSDLFRSRTPNLKVGGFDSPCHYLCQLDFHHCV